MDIKDVVSNKWNFIIDHAEPIEQGVLLWYKGVPYPRRVYWSPLKDPNFDLRVLEALGSVKKYLHVLTFLRGVVIPYRWDIKKYRPFLHHLSHQFQWDLGNLMIKDEEFSVPVWEFGKFVMVILTGIGMDVDLAASFARIVMMILEFDNAYRYMLQDLMGATSKELMKKPVKEFGRLLDLFLERYALRPDNDMWGAKGKFRQVFYLRYLLYIPKFKRVYLRALDSIDLEKLKFNDNDRFHFSFWYGYDYEGKSFEERFNPYEEIYKKVPYAKRVDPKVTADFLTGN